MNYKITVLELLIIWYPITKNISMHGDRYETALYIGNKLGICSKYHDMNTEIDSSIDSTFIFNSHDII